MVYYKVTNLADEPCHMTWNRALLTEEEQAQYDAFKLTDEYIGLTEEDRSMRKKIAESVKTRAFFEELGKDVRIKLYDKQRIGKNVTTMSRYEWKFVIGPSIEELKKLDAFGRPKVSRARKICEQYEIPYSANDTIDQLCDKLSKKFGPNTRILTAQQWLESGLRNRERKEIVLAAKPGVEKAKIVNEGYLTAEELTEVEAYDYLFPKEKVEANESEIQVGDTQSSDGQRDPEAESTVEREPRQTQEAKDDEMSGSGFYEMQ